MHDLIEELITLAKEFPNDMEFGKQIRIITRQLEKAREKLKKK